MNILEWEVKLEGKQKLVKEKILQNLYLLDRQAKTSDERDKYFMKCYYIRECGIYLESVEENVALWSVGFTNSQDKTRDNIFYFYTDLEGQLLFNGLTFRYATPFSQGISLVNENNNYYFIDIKKEKIYCIDKEININQICNYKNGMVAILDNNRRWGAYKLNLKTKTLEGVIPFIWAYLCISRKQDIVYAGIWDEYYIDEVGDHISTRIYGLPQLEAPVGFGKWEKSPSPPTHSRYFILKMNIARAQNEKYIKGYFNSPPIDERDYGWLYYRGATDMGMHFGEKQDEQLGYNDGTIVKTKELGSYKKILIRNK